MTHARLALAALSLALTGLVAIAADAPVSITELFRRDHPELADKEIIVKRIELGPGASAPPHVHPGMVTGYVETGALEFQLKGGPLLKLKAGDTFFEPPGTLPAGSPEAAADACVRGVVEPEIKGLKLADAFTTRLAIAIK